MTDDFLDLLTSGLAQSLSEQVQEVLVEKDLESMDVDTMSHLSQQVMAAMEEVAPTTVERMNKELLSFDPMALETPYYITDETLIRNNLEVLAGVMKETGCHILLAQKAFSMFSMYPLVGQYLSGTTASGLYEAKLGYEEMGKEMHKETHIYSPAYKDKDFDEIASICDHIIFNSITQWETFKDRALTAGRSCGLRINPEFSTQGEEHSIYDPCASGSRMGTVKKSFDEALAKGVLDGLDGLHIHTLCEQNSDDLVSTLEVFEQNFGEFLHGCKWLNLGGGHHITNPTYDIPLLVSTINRLKETYDLEIYLEPGEAIALNAGFLVATVMDIMENDLSIGILDTSAACHMPDVLEMPYRPNIIGSGMPNEKEYTYRFGGPTCLSGDIIGDYSFDEPLKIGDRLVFCDMAIYSMVKNNTFNGMPLPTIAKVDCDGNVQIVKEFGYEDFKGRLS